MSLESFSISESPVQKVWISLLLAAVIFIAYIPLQSIFTPNDHEGYVAMVQEASTGRVDSSELRGKLAVGYVYAVMQSFGDYRLFTLTAFFSFLFILVRRVKNVETLAIYFLIFAPISPYFWYITKEALLLFIVLFSFSFHIFVSKKYSVFIFFTLLFFFSLFIRNYYLPLIFSALFISHFRKFEYRIFFVFFALLVLTISDGIVEFVFNAKYDMWARLYYYSKVNTIFEVDFVRNPNIIDLARTTISNYLQLLFTIVRFPDHRGLIVTIHILFMYVIVSTSLKYASHSISIFCLLLVLFIAFMVPDSGTFIRHASALCFLIVGSFLLGKRQKSEF